MWIKSPDEELWVNTDMVSHASVKKNSGEFVTHFVFTDVDNDLHFSSHGTHKDAARYLKDIMVRITHGR